MRLKDKVAIITGGSHGMGDFYVKLLSIVEKEPEICYSIKGK